MVIKLAMGTEELCGLCKLVEIHLFMVSEVCWVRGDTNMEIVIHVVNTQDFDPSLWVSVTLKNALDLLHSFYSAIYGYMSIWRSQLSRRWIWWKHPQTRQFKTKCLKFCTHKISQSRTQESPDSLTSGWSSGETLANWSFIIAGFQW